ncbi:tRNA (adenosine(37)-N6)-threonylcarbamoyltransferase complex transferase subunit TsaD [Candidatus Aerophobetes bacterium]|uniref:tRNA N6-adenosine threonylcarbamoyltransferase n=1 Tax=Aerophobetes bacterium TaxID=2030807 RepID=A0A2A4YCQ4_UNCAE|nr:MAG: tRNA (adenosine(37)-N6)-threonylcarbamoyltransferase complex transferase subunit TsaD [Candidatus Aerophobetes bacterium]
MLILGIESTCDETAIAIVENGRKIHSNVLRSQIETHKRYGGVFPELASRQHVDHLLPLIERALKEAGYTKRDIDLIAVSYAPGLIGCIVMGLNCAKALSYALDIPFIGVHHVEAHLYSAIMSRDEKATYPALGLVLSGGHTLMARIDDIGSYTLLGSTVDDAIGECFDKVARFLDLPYPGGPEIEKLALSGNATKYPFKAGRVKGKPLHFSFSGLKTNVLYSIKGQNNNKKAPSILSEDEKADVAASFQEAAFKDIIKKTILAARMENIQDIYLGGGVTNSSALRAMFEKADSKLNFHFPKKELCQDNAAMIAGLGYHKYLSGNASSLDLEAIPRVQL